MKKVVMLLALLAAFGCGATPQESTVPPPAEVETGPGVATAPDGVSIAYTVAGSGSPVLVFVHGWMCDQSFWASQVDAFTPEHTVVTIDLAGHGASGTSRDGWPLMAFGGDVAAVVDQLGLDEVILIGHSMGGPVVLEAARLRPEKVVGIIGVDTLKDADFKYDPEQMKPFMEALESDFAGACRGFVAQMFPDGADAALMERVGASMCSGPSEIGIALMRQFMDYDAPAAFSAVSAGIPIHCINATSGPSNIEGNRAYHADFDIVTMEGVGHFLMIEKPEEFNARLEAAITGM